MSSSCEVCGKTFSTTGNYNKHQRNVHGLEAKPVVGYKGDFGTYKCLEGCELSFKICGALRQHLVEQHNAENNVKKFNFDSHKDFSSWLEMIEEQNLAQYVKTRGSNKIKDGKMEKEYLSCSRSGKSQCKNRENRKRSVSSKGLSKTGIKCTSQVVVTKNMRTGKVSVVYYVDHYGHQNDVRHLRLSKRTYADIASKLISGVSSDRILDTIRDTRRMNDKVKRIDIITKQDINNIRRSLKINVKNEIRNQHSDNATNEDLIEEKSLTGDDNPLMYYEKEGAEKVSEEKNVFEEECVELINEIITNVQSINYVEEEQQMILKYLKVARSITVMGTIDSCQEICNNQSDNEEVDD